LTGAFPVDVKVVRTSDDATSARTQNELYWYSYTEIIDQRFRYPNSALVFLRFDSRQFNNIPAVNIWFVALRLPFQAMPRLTPPRT
jgi:predicted phage tail protein